jgi:transposase
MRNIFESGGMAIGKHEWRIVVRKSRHGGNCTEYQFRRLGQVTWQGSRAWPAYNINDTYLGLPKSLRRLYGSYWTEIQAALNGQPTRRQSLSLHQDQPEEGADQ